MNTLQNRYHNTSVNIRTALSWEQIDEMAYHANRELVQHRTAQDRRIIALHRRIKFALCGSADCKCGTVR